MSTVFDKLQESQLGYAAIFACISVGFLCLRLLGKKEVGPGYWAAGFLSNGLGFVFWSGAVPWQPLVYFLVGEGFHVLGFFLLITGAYRFAGNGFRRWNIAFVLLWLTVWGVSILLFRDHTFLSGFVLKALRSLLFVLAGGILLVEGNREKKVGINIAGISLMAWGIYIVAFAFIPINPYLYYGFLVGLQVLAAFGMVTMVIDKIRVRAERSELQVKTLEGILPICAYCKNIRDENNEWHKLEAYIQDRSKAEFSHGICPECFSKHRPDQ